MSSVRSHRSEIVATVLVLVVVAAAVFALWPRTPTQRAQPDAPTGVAPAAVAGELAPLRAAAALAPCPAAGSTQATGPLVGLSLECLGGDGTVDLGAALAGRPTLINLWASWCGPCRAELPALAEYAGRPGAVPVLGVDVRDDPRPALQMLTDLGARYPSVADPQGKVAAALRAPQAVPLSFLVRADGSVVIVVPPTPFTSADQVAAAVERLS